MPGNPISWDDEKVARLWDYYGSTSSFQNLYFARVYGHYVLRRAKLPTDAALRIIDFGCGPGYMWEHVNRRGTHWMYQGLEFSTDSAEALRKRASSHSNFMGVVVANGLPSSLAANDFDVGLLIEVVEHLTDEKLESSITELHRILKPGGALVVTAPHDEDLALETRLCPNCNTLFHQWQHVRTWRPTTLQKAFEKFGFEHERSWVGHWDDHHLPGWLSNRALRVLRGKRIDVHFLSIFRRRSSQ